LKLKIIIIFSLITIGANSIFSQSAMSLEFTSLSYHNADWQQDISILERKLDTIGKWLYEPGYQLSYEKFFYLTVWSVEFRQSLFRDAANHLAANFSPTIKWRFLHLGKHYLNLSFGPIVTYRNSWKDIPLYQNREEFLNTRIKDWRAQWKFRLSLALRYNVYITPRIDLSLSFMYNNEWGTYTSGIGLRYWINPYIMNNERGCMSCGKATWKHGWFRKWWHKIWK